MSLKVSIVINVLKYNFWHSTSDMEYIEKVLGWNWNTSIFYMIRMDFIQFSTWLVFYLLQIPQIV